MPATVRPLTLGEKLPPFSLPSATDGQTYSPASFARSNYLVVIFLANHCPYVSAWEDRIVAIANEFRDRGVAFVAISSNDADEFPDDSPEGMAKRAEQKAYPFPYLYDESQSVARAFGAMRTPEVFVFDQDRTLRYHGAVDSDYEESAGMTQYLRDALQQLLAGLDVQTYSTPPVGCSIKWKE